MSHTSKIFDSQPIQVQNLNGFDLSHLNMGTAKTGQLVPVLNKLLMQGSKISVGAAVNCELPPLATNFFGKIDFCVELFFCPCSILYGGWRQFISNQVATMFPSSQDVVSEAGGYALPVLDFGYASIGSPTDVNVNNNVLRATNDGIAEYLGVLLGDDFDDNPDAVEHLYINMLPFLAYHRIWDVFYRNATTTKTIFAVNPNNHATGLNRKNVSLVWHSFYTEDALSDFETSTTDRVFHQTSETTFPDGISLLSTRQRTYERDYFTAGSVSPQQGNPGTVTMEVNIDNEVELSVPALRSIVALQRFGEHLNYDPTYRGIMRNLLGSSPSDAALDEPSYIGRIVIPVYQKSVYNQSPAAAQSSSGNPFSGELGNKGASGSFVGEGSFCNKYRVGCFGYLMALASLVPHAIYAQGIEREMLATEIGDFPFPDLQTVGMDQVYLGEIYPGSKISRIKDTFSYLPRYSWMKYKCDSVHGEMRPGKTLESFALQRVFTDYPDFGTEFVTIKQTDLDGVFGTSVNVSNFSCWYEIYWRFRVVMPLAAFCIPTLGDLKDVHTIHTTQGGAKL